jgi:SAM-dependent methyltransferase
LKAAIPTTYFNRQSGVGLALDNFPRQSNRRIGVVGLGTGTLAAYGRPGDIIRFYDINPADIRLAETRFAYLKQCQAHVDVVLGDARLSLENEPPQQFDVLALDAFSSDAIPVHLLTEQAFAIYLRHLKPDGVIAVHISNRWLDLYPVTRSLASHFNLGMAKITWSGDNGPWSFNTSIWVLLSRNRAFLESAPIAAATDNGPTNSTATRLWTDDYVSLFPILKPMGRAEKK